MKTLLLGTILAISACAKSDYRVCIVEPEGPVCTKNNLSQRDAKLIGEHMADYTGLEVHVQRPKKKGEKVPAPKPQIRKEPTTTLGEGTVIL